MIMIIIKRGRPRETWRRTQRKRGTRWGGRAGGQQKKPPGTGQGGEICASPYAPRGGKKIDKMNQQQEFALIITKRRG